MLGHGIEGRNVLGTLDRLDSTWSLMASTGRLAIDGRVSEPTNGAGGFRLASPRMAVALGALSLLTVPATFVIDAGGIIRDVDQVVPIETPDVDRLIASLSACRA